MTRSSDELLALNAELRAEAKRLNLWGWRCSATIPADPNHLDYGGNCSLHRGHDGPHEGVHVFTVREAVSW